MPGFLPSLLACSILLLLLLDLCLPCINNLSVDVDVTGEGKDCVYIFTRPKNFDDSCPSLLEAANKIIEERSDDDLIGTSKHRLYLPRSGHFLQLPLHEKLPGMIFVGDLQPDMNAYYPLDTDSLDYSKGAYNGISSGSPAMYSDDAICGHSRFFDGASKIDVEAFSGYDWGSTFSASAWFKRTGQFDNYQGIVNNGYYKSASWEIRMGNKNNGTKLGGGVITGDSDTAWDYSESAPTQNEWHHVVLSYDGDVRYLTFYVNGVLQVGNIECCSGPIVTRNNPVTIGQAGTGQSGEYFYGFIDEVKLFNKALSSEDVMKLYDQPCSQND